MRVGLDVALTLALNLALNRISLNSALIEESNELSLRTKWAHQARVLERIEYSHDCRQVAYDMVSPSPFDCPCRI